MNDSDTDNALSAMLNRVFCMDALELLRRLPDDSIDITVTSPPYDNLRAYKGYAWDFEGIARESYRVLKPGGVLVWIVGDATVNGSETLTSMRQALYFVDGVGFRMHDTMIYRKNPNVMNNHHPRCLDAFEYMFVLSKGTPKVFNPPLKRNITEGQLSGGGKRQRDGVVKTFQNSRQPTAAYSLDINIWYFPSGGKRQDKFATAHPATFPEKLAKRHILTWSNPGDVVLDYFLGSGTTAKMARANGRRYIGCDISAEYVAIAERRLSQPFTLPMLFEETEVAP